MMRVLLPHSPRVFQPGPHGTQNTPLDLNPPTYQLGGLLRSPGHMFHNCPKRDLAPTESTTAIDATSGDRDMTHSGSRLVGVRGLTDCCENPGYGARERVLRCSNGIDVLCLHSPRSRSPARGFMSRDVRFETQTTFEPPCSNTIPPEHPTKRLKKPTRGKSLTPSTPDPPSFHPTGQATAAKTPLSTYGSTHTDSRSYAPIAPTPETNSCSRPIRSYTRLIPRPKRTPPYA